MRGPFWSGGLTSATFHNFRQELAQGGGLSSYPHPYLMPDFWQFPTVSMGLGPLLSIYQARLNRYLRARGLTEGPEPKVWAFVGDGETDEPETLGSLTLAARENLDNLIWVVNCNLQRLDGPVRGNGKIIQELEAAFQGAGWNVIKVIWGSDWDALLAADTSGLLIQRMEEAVDGDYQKYSVEPGSYTRRHFFGRYPELLELVNHLTDEQIHKLLRGGHDSRKVYAAYQAAVEHSGRPTVILAKTVKGYGLGEAGEGRNITHQQKKLNEKELRDFAPVSACRLATRRLLKTPFFLRRPTVSRRSICWACAGSWAGFYPGAWSKAQAAGGAEVGRLWGVAQGLGAFGDVHHDGLRAAGGNADSRSRRSGGSFADYPDEAQTLGLDALFREVGHLIAQGTALRAGGYGSRCSTITTQRRPDSGGGITEAGAMASFIARGRLRHPMAAASCRFTSTTRCSASNASVISCGWRGISGPRGSCWARRQDAPPSMAKGLQHQDGHSLILSSAIPTLLTYDPAFSYEVAVIIAEGLRRMFVKGEDIFYYLTLYNENYAMPAMPPGWKKESSRDFTSSSPAPRTCPCGRHLLGSGPILRSALRPSKSWPSTTTFGRCLERHQLQALAQRRPARPPLEHAASDAASPEIACRAGPRRRAGRFRGGVRQHEIVPDQIAPWVPGGLTTLGTDGFGRSDTRERLRRFFEVDAESTVIATLYALAEKGQVERSTVQSAIRDLDVDPEKAFPQTV